MEFEQGKTQINPEFFNKIERVWNELELEMMQAAKVEGVELDPLDKTLTLFNAYLQMLVQITANNAPDHTVPLDGFTDVFRDVIYNLWGHKLFIAPITEVELITEEGDDNGNDAGRTNTH